MESNWIKVITNNINLNKNKTEMSKTILRTVILLVAGAVLLCGCEKKKEDTPKPNPPKVNISVEFEHKVIKCKILNPVKINVYKDHIIVKNPASKGIKFQSSNPSVLSVTDQCVITLQKRDSALVYLTLEDNDKIYRDTLRVFSHLPSKMESYYIMKGFDLNRDSCMSDYEMSRIEEVDKFYIEDAFLLKGIKSVSYEIPHYSSLCGQVYTCDFSQNNAMEKLRIKADDYLQQECHFIKLLLPSESKMRSIELTAYWFPELIDFELPYLPSLDSLTIDEFTLHEIDLSNSNNVRYINLLGCLGLHKVDLSKCNNLTYICISPVKLYPNTEFCDLILSHDIYEKYKNGSPDLKVTIVNELVNVIEAK